jgi:hypothetical protein
VYFQSFYQIMHVLPFSGKINFQDFFQTAEDLKDQLPLILTTMQ